MTNSKVTTEHLDRAAYLYVRQSTLQQVVENTESTARQYALKNRALALGWRKNRIEIIDDDLGLSGTNAKERKGFQRLVAEVGLGNVGLVMGLEVSRLARNNADWQRLLEICSLTDTLILDEDGLYDTNNINDRMVLGLKGTLSEMEIHTLRSRLQGGILNKAQRGELKLRLPTGFVYDDADKIVLDPDQQVRETVTILFTSFQRTGSAYAVVRYFREKGLNFPGRVWNGPNAGVLVWTVLRHHRVLQVLHNPCYAGAFVYGRTKWKRDPIDGVKRSRRLPQDKWKVFLPNNHDGYISWEQYQQNRKQLLENAVAHGRDRRRSPPGSGPALLQGLVLCNKCGNRMTVQYYIRRNKLVPRYVCQREGIENATSICQIIPGGSIDEAIGRLLVEMVTPTSLEVSMQVFNEIRSRREEVLRHHKAQLERARHEAELAQRRFLLVDPGNRLVADNLERSWNETLRAVASLEEEYDRVAKEQIPDLTTEQITKVRTLAEDFPAIWNDPRTSARERKRMVRLLIEDVALLKTNVIHLKIRFKGGSTKEMEVPIPPKAWEARKTAPSIIELIGEMARTKTDSEIVAELNKQGARSGTGLPFTTRLVCSFRHNNGIPGMFEHLREKGFLTAKELAVRIGVCVETVRKWGKTGLLKAHRYNDRGQSLYEDPGQEIPVKWTRRKRTTNQATVQNVLEDTIEV